MKPIRRSVPVGLFVVLLIAVPAGAQRRAEPRPGAAAPRTGTPAPRGRQAAPKPAAPAALSPVEQARLNQFLEGWEKHSATLQTLRADFVRYGYSFVFPEADEKGNPKLDAQGNPEPKISTGTLVYKAPDKGKYEIHGKDGERWICTGKEIYQYSPATREVVVYQLPPEMQGEGITEAPLPFIFGMKAEQAKQRYRLRLLQLQNLEANEVCVEVIPLRQQDAANYRRCLIILDRQTYLPRAVKVEEPSAAAVDDPDAKVNYEIYAFYDKRGRSTIRANDSVRDSEFRATTPLGYKLSRDELSATGPHLPRRPADKVAVPIPESPVRKWPR